MFIERKWLPPANGANNLCDNVGAGDPLPKISTGYVTKDPFDPIE